ncbi:MAG: ImmA/IrrE family metallo-endopeptidase [Oscillospiraceae bacterium]|nr:ImmA/IrrE family metallo-endopeptidase [Oscillospiraceae bacterium]
MLDKLDLSTKAQELREILGEDANSPVDIFSLVSQIEELTLVLYPLGKNISGMCLRDDHIKLIAINSSMSYGRQRFSLAHELFHLYYDNESGFKVCSKMLNPKSDNEKNADQFASYFLAPYKSLKDAIKKESEGKPISLKSTIALEQYFGMSHLAMLWRLVSEGYLSQDSIEEYSYGVKTIARNLGYDDKLYSPTPVDHQKITLGYYLIQLELMREKDLVSKGKIDELLIDAFRDDIAFGLYDENGGEAID